MPRLWMTATAAIPAFLLLLPLSLSAQDQTEELVLELENRTQAVEDDPQLVPERAEEEKGAPVRVVHEGTDTLGRRMVLSLRERLSDSDLFHLSQEEGRKISIHVYSRDEFTDRPGLSSIYSITWTFSYGEEVLSSYLQNSLGILERNRIGETAEDLAGRTYEVYRRYSYLFQD